MKYIRMNMRINPEEKAKYKKEVKESLEEFLKRNNLLGAEPQLIMSVLPQMYQHLEANGLVKYGLNYNLFSKFAQESFIMAQFMRGF